MSAQALRFRRVEPVWIIGGVILALMAHGLVWGLVTWVFGLGGADDTARQLSLALFWIIGAVVLWKISLPPSRLHAIFLVMLCALFVAAMGTLAAFFRLLLIDHAQFDADHLKTFFGVTSLMVLAQVLVALPAGAVLQGVMLTRKAA